MIPAVNDILSSGLELETAPSLDYGLVPPDDAVIGTVDGLDAMKPVVYKILNTERFGYTIYSQDYGIELEDLFGEPFSYVCLELRDRITEALTQDDRIEDVSGFEFSSAKKGEVTATFTVHTIFDDVDAERTVNF